MVQILYEDIVCKHWSYSTDSVTKYNHIKISKKDVYVHFIYIWTKS